MPVNWEHDTLIVSKSVVKIGPSRLQERIEALIKSKSNWRGCTGKGGEAEEAFGQKHDGGSQEDGCILKIDWLEIHCRL
jgi:hypothetical protein